ncbi:hypothetical protein Srot_0098 [Segniliparus rotundus DSM 44985]|uniref:Uncharacterized protein n=1 Tax=Segniliparus rotundus (strain ATCC BAA-972 / CDC 1076 / CIP 108378 / DSM 44985 / JCM 13578) TaxID=640132 RepID=D6Z9R2_SEGRD|nr:hypothetical protein [Segniliparus rotundus]ADG96589.1 hypothetical protein Srot_0098 [Segniliparus rotundus DSM 44985]
MTGQSLRTAASGALLVGALLVAGWSGNSAADPDFPDIPQANADVSQESGAAQQRQGSTEQSTAEEDTAGQATAPEDDNAPADGLASPQDCVVIKHLVAHVDVLLQRQVSVTQGFPTGKEGEQAVSLDLDLLNQALPFLVGAETGVQDAVQRAKVTKYKNDLGQLSLVLAERKTQNLSAPAPYAWVDKLSAASNQAGRDYLDIGNSCVV